MFKRKKKTKLELEAYMAESVLRNTLLDRIDELTKANEEYSDSLRDLLQIVLETVALYERFLLMAKRGGPQVPYLAIAQLETVEKIKQAVQTTFEAFGLKGLVFDDNMGDKDGK